ncbi:MAG: hypothetical protein JSR55_00080 [Proteobacteria bacterium]|nr:hypothetical protein [Pseudomonadota bacterium]
MALPLHNLNAEPAPERSTWPGYEIARLALLHDEARETALLANLLGRTPYAAAALAIGALAIVIFVRGTMPIAEPAVWLALMLIGVGAMARNYAHAIRQPFERGILREFAYDLNAIAMYVGFAWGAGAYLALGPQTSPLALTAFAVAIPAFMAVTLRTREISLGVLAPVAALSAFAAVLRPLPEGPLAAAFVLIACAAVGGAIFWASRLLAPVPAGVRLSETSAA